MQIVTVSIHDLQSMLDRAAEKVIQTVYQEQNNASQTNLDEVLTVQQAADFLRLSPPTVYALISKGELPVLKRSKRCYFLKVDLINYLKQGRKKTIAEAAVEADSFLTNKRG